MTDANAIVRLAPNHHRPKERVISMALPPGPDSMIAGSLSDYGFVEPRGGLATSEDEAVNLAAQIGYPVALKICSPGILHKSDIGGVELGLDCKESVRAAFRRIYAAAQQKEPRAYLEGVRVEEMVSGGVEIIIGLKKDVQFGPVIMFGLGGIFTELMDDVSFRVLPITLDDAREMVNEIRGARVLQGFRGRKPVSEDLLINLLLAAGRFGLALGNKLKSADFNPIVVWDNEHRLLDFKMVLNDEPIGPSVTPAPSRGPDVRHLATFFQARSIAVVGASSDPDKLGYWVLHSVAKQDYKGEVFPVNPSKKSILGLETFPSLSAVPKRVELVICMVDLGLVPSLLRECLVVGAHNLVILSGGGKELGGERAAIEAEIGRIARELDVRVIGPNCVGVFDGTTRVNTLFQPPDRMPRPPAGPVAVLSQSGTVGVAFLEDAAPFGISKFVSYGNRVDVDEADLLSFLADDPHTQVICLYVEGFENGRGFLEAARQVAVRKPVVILKSGRTASAGQAALTHTGFFAGSHKVVDGAFRQAGLIAVDTYEELLAVTKALALQPRAQGARVAMISNGIGTTVQALDLMGAAGLELAVLAPATKERLAAIYPPFYIVENPVDLTGSGSSTDYEAGIEILLGDPAVDIVMPWLVLKGPAVAEDISEKLDRLNQTSAKPILVGMTGGKVGRRKGVEIESLGIPVFHTVRDWVAAARGLAFRSGG